MQRYEAILALGEGSSGTIWKCRDKETNSFVAIKVFKDAHRDAEGLRAATREANLLHTLRRQRHVVKLLEAFRSDSGRVYLVMELVDFSLSHKIRQLREQGKRLGGMDVKWIMYQLIQAVSCLHRSKIFHRDLKPANILLNQDGTLKLCDFGLARYTPCFSSRHGHEDLTPYVITRWYRPPEVLMGSTYGAQVDIWAIGCIFAEMVLGMPLFPGKSHLDQLFLVMHSIQFTPQQIRFAAQRHAAACQARCPAGTEAKAAFPIPEHIMPLEARLPQFTPDMMQVLKACLQADPLRRSTADELLKMPYFDDVRGTMSFGASNGALQPCAPSPMPSPCALLAQTSLQPAAWLPSDAPADMYHHRVADSGPSAMSAPTSAAPACSEGTHCTPSRAQAHHTESTPAPAARLISTAAQTLRPATQEVAPSPQPLISKAYNGPRTPDMCFIEYDACDQALRDGNLPPQRATSIGGYHNPVCADERWFYNTPPNGNPQNGAATSVPPRGMHAVVPPSGSMAAVLYGRLNPSEHRGLSPAGMVPPSMQQAKPRLSAPVPRTAMHQSHHAAAEHTPAMGQGQPRWAADLSRGDGYGRAAAAAAAVRAPCLHSVLDPRLRQTILSSGNSCSTGSGAGSSSHSSSFSETPEKVAVATARQAVQSEAIKHELKMRRLVLSNSSNSSSSAAIGALPVDVRMLLGSRLSVPSGRLSCSSGLAAAAGAGTQELAGPATSQPAADPAATVLPDAAALQPGQQDQQQPMTAAGLGRKSSIMSPLVAPLLRFISSGQGTQNPPNPHSQQGSSSMPMRQPPLAAA